MKAISTGSQGMTLESVLIRKSPPMFEVILKVSMFRTLKIRPELVEIREGFLGEAVKGLGQGLTLKVGYWDAWTTVVFQPEDEEEKNALAGRTYQRTEKDEFALVFVPEESEDESQILQNRIEIAAST